MDIRQYDIGDSVLVSRTVESGRDESGENKIPVHTRLTFFIAGRVVGLKRLYFGKREYAPAFISETEVAPEIAYLNTTSSLLLWEVRFGLLNKPVYVLPEHLVPTRKRPLPLLYRETLTPSASSSFDELKNQLDVERIGHRDRIRKLEAELAAERITTNDKDGE